MRRGSIFQLVLIGVLAGAVASAFALIPVWLPTAASDEAARINFVFWFVTAICIGVFAVVAAVLLYSIWKFRARPDDDSDGPPIHGHTGLEIVWTAIPTLLVTSIGIISAVVLARNSDAGANPLRVDVLSQQFAWSFTYPEAGNLQTGQLRLPVGRKVELHLTARDVLHSFWVPEFSQKQDTVPGEETTLVITPKQTGTFPVICTELCGLGHAIMRTQVIVMPQGEFDAWLREQGERLAAPGGEAGEAVFTNNGCGSCHTFGPAGSSAEVGPNLDNLPQAAEAAGVPLEEYVRQSIVEPNAVVAEGFQPNVMPATFAELPQEQLDALVQFLTQPEGG